MSLNDKRDNKTKYQNSTGVESKPSDHINTLAKAFSRYSENKKNEKLLISVTFVDFLIGL